MDTKGIESPRWSEDYFELLALEKNWLPWWCGWRLWPLAWMSTDEYLRRTLVIGPVVFPLWRCRCKECKSLHADLKARVEVD